MNHIVALSGGKDSTALALRLREVEPREYTYICTPTGDELPDMLAHWAKLEVMLQAPLVRVTNRTLAEWIDHYGALPNWRQRWCTRQLKIEPTKAYLARHAPCTLYVGLRADEPEREGGIYDDVPQRFPLREWGWGVNQVKNYLAQRGVSIPKRTDCARCFGQRLKEWHRLWTDHPDIYADAVAQEARTGATFRSPGRDSWPTGLLELGAAFATRKPPGAAEEAQGDLFICRACSL